VVGFVLSPLGNVRDLLVVEQLDQCSRRAVATQILSANPSSGIVDISLGVNRIWKVISD
jgi:hypothetical protein